ncbi:MAG: sensor domain-containing diguanylate cyclase [Deltaproteobacteria bacterium]|nr:MAG: sensor domain-containing diguanylate cyclase [Deltaproteobacteria bacterium]
MKEGARRAKKGQKQSRTVKKTSKNNRGLTKKNHQLEEKLLELYTLYNVSKTLMSVSLQLDGLFEVVMKLIHESLRVDEHCLMLFDQDRSELNIHAYYGMDEKLMNKITFKPGEGIPGKAAESGKPILVNDMSKKSDYNFYKGRKKLTGSFLSVPLKIGEDDVIGVLNFRKPKKNAFTKRDVELFSSVAEHVAIAIGNAQLYQRTRELTNKDALTGLYNRRYFFERFEKEIERAYRYHRILSVLMLDLDHFKEFNDENGHLKGDDVLRETAGVLLYQLRTSDVLARFGGDEFIILLPETDKESATVVADKLRDGVYKNNFIGEENIPSGKITISLGLATYPQDSSDAFQLINFADRALYRSKSKGGNLVCSYVPEDNNG